jgi:SSS family solute:Na+ symporter
LYTTSGGLRASVITDAFQFAAFAILLPVTLLVVLAFHLKGGPTEFVDRIVTMTERGFASQSPLQIAGLIAAFLLGETLIPPYANRALASKTTGTSRNGFVLAGLFSVAWFAVMVALGVAAHGVIPEGTDEDHVLLRLVGAIMSDAGHALLMLILVSVVMSSLDSLMNAGAVAFTQDIVKPVVDLTDDAALKTGRWATVVIAVVASTATRVVPSIIDGLLICYTIWAAGILPVLILGLWVKQPRPLAGILSMTVGTVVSMIAIIFLFVFPEAVGVQVIIVPALAAALAAYACGHWMGTRSAGGTA